MATEGNHCQLDELAAKMVKISWLMRVARQWMYANGLADKEFSEKAIMALWLLSLSDPRPFSALARFLRLSSNRTKEVLRPLLAMELIQEREDSRLGLTKMGKDRLQGLIAQSAERYRNMLAGTSGSDEELSHSLTFASRILEAAETQVRTWVFGQGHR